MHGIDMQSHLDREVKRLKPNATYVLRSHLSPNCTSSATDQVSLLLSAVSVECPEGLSMHGLDLHTTTAAALPRAMLTRTPAASAGQHGVTRHKPPRERTGGTSRARTTARAATWPRLSSDQRAPRRAPRAGTVLRRSPTRWTP